MTLVDPAPTIPRDTWQRPLIIPPGGGKPVAYTRITRFIDVLEDKYNLQQWEKRLVMLGIVDRPDLAISAAAHRHDKDKLNQIAKEAKEYAKASEASNVGTAVHKICERLDQGEDVGILPGEYQRDIDAYLAVTVPRLKHLLIEQFVVIDDLKVGGTPDRFSEWVADPIDPPYGPPIQPGDVLIADIKTGDTRYGHGKMSTQMALGAHGNVYSPRDGARTDLPERLRTDWGVIIHLPAGTGTCQLIWADLTAGWEAVTEHAAWVRKWQRRKDLLVNFNDTISTLQTAGLITDPVLAEIGAAQSRQQVTDVWTSHKNGWTDEHTAAAKTRLAALTERETA